MLQSGIALSSDGVQWVLVNASPDLRAQIEASEELQPRGDQSRSTPISAVLLTNADLDHVLGIFLLRENGDLNLCAPEGTRRCLQEDLRVDQVVGAYSRVRWHSPPEADAPAESVLGTTRLVFRAIPLPASAPRYSGCSAEGQSVAYEIRGDAGTLVIAPDVGEITPELGAAMERAAGVLFDGTFWSDDELRQIQPKARTAREMGHLPVCESLPLLARLPARVKAYIHINNTNPILHPGSPERAKLEESGVRIAREGSVFEI